MERGFSMAALLAYPNGCYLNMELSKHDLYGSKSEALF